MNFLKENLFLTVTVAIVIVGVSLAVVLKHSEDSKADEYAEKCAKLGGQIVSLASGGINEDRKDAAERHVRKMGFVAGEIKEDSVRRSRSGYQVMRFQIGEKEIPAFPVELFKDRERLHWLVSGQYGQQVGALLKLLKPTVPPGDTEIALEADRIRAQESPREKTDKTGSPALPTGAVRPTEPRRRTEDGRIPFGRSESRGFGASEVRRPEVRRGSNLTGADGGPTIEGRAMESVVLRRSNQGWIYADRNSMFKASGPDSTHYNEVKLWFRQVSLWIQQDIIETIILTNKQVRPESGSGGNEGVSASAVKRLMGIDIYGYVLGQTSSAGEFGRGDAFGQPAAPASMDVSLMYLNPEEGTSSPDVPKLTQHACNKLYDVVHYKFTVVMPMKHLHRLQKNLCKRNYHTILLVKVGRSAGSTGQTHHRGGEASGSKQQPGGLFYYGPDSVREVEITAQLLMLADWTRGRWNQQAKDWDENYPPLMPVDFLKLMSQKDPGVLRPEDTKRLPATDAPVGGVFGSEFKRRGPS